jgi:nucleolar pre-ribosomal-associated protein 1
MIATLYTLFQTHPQNTYQPSHIAPLIAIYRGTLAETDRQLLDIFRTFEKIRKYSCSPIIFKWNPIPNMPQATVVGAIANLDSAAMFRSCTEFPEWRKLEQEPESQVPSSDSALYDPLFVVLFLGMLSTDTQVTGSMTSMDWLHLFRSNIVCLLVRTLSAREDEIRALAWNVFGALLQTLQVWSPILFTKIIPDTTQGCRIS